MNKLKLLNEKLSSIENLANEINKATLPIMKSLAQDDNNITIKIKKILHDHNKVKIDKKDTKGSEIKIIQNKAITEAAREIVQQFTRDSQQIVGEIDEFSETIIDGEYELDDEVCPFFTSVWNGDLYGKTDIDSLDCLIDDLKKQYLAASSKTLITRVVDHFQEIKHIIPTPSE
jgi:hypothetical protein